MESIRRWRPSPALAVSFLALFVALSGSAASLSGKNNIDHNDLRGHVVHTPKIHDQAVTQRKLADGAVNEDKIKADETFIPSDIKATPAGPFAIPVNAINIEEIAGGAVTASKLADSAFLDFDIARPSPGGSFGIPSDAIQAGELDNNSVNASEIAHGAVNASEIANGEVKAAEIGDGIHRHASSTTFNGVNGEATRSCGPNEEIVGGNGRWSIHTTSKLSIVSVDVNHVSESVTVNGANDTGFAHTLTADAHCLEP